ncbi:hypothetical protein XENTR_v10021936 [Xenopus tropicalis]|uniref:Carbohydrate sulfotransferase n=1 Tax=Xenopus tropicalis TaxID=8364 RepID=A0A6I8RAL9_XENTR|nr:carbohydrate sulfotransferase 8 [Xenopus tropicalis]KAE8587337.1 hypothetical protein XENTR_v10021936 [Xenopus tropicalis]KAE8587338.1 hypothetical protein XENTR_v10021936 [Xenopus tropicalis]KAE8587339.1 hypothetical protein XENTR_v10021936 [Xenopus tropicalis]
MARITKNTCCFITLFSTLLWGFTSDYKWLNDSDDKGHDEFVISQMNRTKLLKSACQQSNLSKPFGRMSPFVARSLFVEQKHKFIICAVPKVGCTNWKRIILLLKLNLSTEVHFEHNAIHESAFLKRLSDYPADQQRMMLTNYTKVMFTRHPFQRIVSAYRDKFLHPGDYYKHIANIIKSQVRKVNTPEPVTFKEFVQYIVQQVPTWLDIHWMPMHLLCDPCNINYNILGKFETLKRDSDQVLKTIGAPSNLKYPELKQYNESRTDTNIVDKYFSTLPLNVLDLLVKLYNHDFMLFGYS